MSQRPRLHRTTVQEITWLIFDDDFDAIETAELSGGIITIGRRPDTGLIAAGHIGSEGFVIELDNLPARRTGKALP